MKMASDWETKNNIKELKDTWQRRECAFGYINAYKAVIWMRFKGQSYTCFTECNWKYHIILSTFEKMSCKGRGADMPIHPQEWLSTKICCSVTTGE